jgi:hypothetical protein
MTTFTAGGPSMGLRWGRLLAGVAVAEIVPIVLLVALVAIFGPQTQAEAEVYAARIGRWVGPVGGAGMCLLAAWWVARPLGHLGLRHGLALGVLAAGLDMAILVASGAPFEWLFAASNAGWVLAGGLGGFLGSRPSQAAS